MYTRSYNIRSQKQPEPPEEPKPAEELDIPEGYSGTLMLREQESPKEAVREEQSFEDERPPIRRHKPVKFSFTKSPRSTEEASDEKERTAQNERVRSEYSVPCKCGTSLFEPEPDVTCRDTEAVCLGQRKRKPELDRMLLGALMLMLISEGTDDVLLLILGYLFM